MSTNDLNLHLSVARLIAGCGEPVRNTVAPGPVISPSFRILYRWNCQIPVFLQQRVFGNAQPDLERPDFARARARTAADSTTCRVPCSEGHLAARSQGAPVARLYPSLACGGPAVEERVAATKGRLIPTPPLLIMAATIVGPVMLATTKRDEGRWQRRHGYSCWWRRQRSRRRWEPAVAPACCQRRWCR